MSNLVILLADAYENCKKESDHNETILGKIKIFLKENWLVLLILSMICILIICSLLAIFSVYKDNNENNIIFLIADLFAFYLLIKVLDFKEKSNYQRRRYKYYAAMNKFKNILKNKFHLYSKYKIHKLIDEANKVLEELERENKLIQYMIKIWEKAIVPIISFGAGIFLGNDKILETMPLLTILQLIISSVLIMIILVIVMFACNAFINSVTSGQKRRVKNLIIVLKDIEVKNFI